MRVGVWVEHPHSTNRQPPFPQPQFWRRARHRRNPNQLIISRGCRTTRARDKAPTSAFPGERVSYVVGVETDMRSHTHVRRSIHAADLPFRSPFTSASLELSSIYTRTCAPSRVNLHPYACVFDAWSRDALRQESNTQTSHLDGASRDKNTPAHGRALEQCGGRQTDRQRDGRRRKKKIPPGTQRPQTLSPPPFPLHARIGKGPR